MLRYNGTKSYVNYILCYRVLTDDFQRGQVLHYILLHMHNTLYILYYVHKHSFLKANAPNTISSRLSANGMTRDYQPATRVPERTATTDHHCCLVR